jgi:hypothetical protein
LNIIAPVAVVVLVPKVSVAPALTVNADVEYTEPLRTSVPVMDVRLVTVRFLDCAVVSSTVLNVPRVTVKLFVTVVVNPAFW